MLARRSDSTGPTGAKTGRESGAGPLTVCKGINPPFPRWGTATGSCTSMPWNSGNPSRSAVSMPRFNVMAEPAQPWHAPLNRRCTTPAATSSTSTAPPCEAI